jgi:poly(A) polymerase
MKIAINEPRIAEIGRLFTANGAAIRLVGGSVRDRLLGIDQDDNDFATDARPERVLEFAERAGYRVIPTGLQHGTVTVVVEGEPFEVTTLRADVETDGRHAKVEFVTSFEADAGRRDFTINAMSSDLDGQVYDYFGGQADLLARKIRFVGDLDARITEDYLRILRFFRFRARYGGQEERSDLNAIKAHVGGLDRISGERIWKEVAKILVGPDAYGTLMAMDYCGVSSRVGFHPEPAAFLDRTSAAIRENVTDPAIALGIVAGTAPQGRDVSIGERWRLGKAEVETATAAFQVKTAILAAGVSGDDIGSGLFWTKRMVDGLPRSVVEQVLPVFDLRHVIGDIPDQLPVFPVKGGDLVALGLKPGREIGVHVASLRSRWMDEAFAPTREELLTAFAHDAGLSISATPGATV